MSIITKKVVISQLITLGKILKTTTELVLEADLLMVFAMLLVDQEENLLFQKMMTHYVNGLQVKVIGHAVGLMRTIGHG